jgi:putative membrane protein
MDSTAKVKEKASLSDFLAVERTFLAWIRTGLALMGFGFVVARFGLFLEEFHAALPASAPAPHRFSLWSGTALIAVGVAVNLYSAWRHVHLMEALNRGETGDTHSSRQAVIVAVVLAVFGLTMAVYLAFLRSGG